MKALLSLAAGSLRHRRVPTLLTLASIALSTALLLGIEQTRSGLRASFADTISGTDLVVGARGERLQLILASVLGLGTTSHTLSYASFERYRGHPAVAWAIPYSLGDSHRGFRVVGTSGAFFEHYRYRGGRPVDLAQGRPFAAASEVVLGSQVAEALGYQLGDPVVATHGLGGAGIQDHDRHPFAVVGILARTATPIDRSLYVSLDGIGAMHDDLRTEGPPVDFLTAVFLATHSRMDALRLQREINDDRREPLTAVLPGVALSELWRSLSLVEGALRLVVLFVVAVGFLGLLVSIYSALQERRREMAVLRALGAPPRAVAVLLTAEATLLSLGGAVAGVVLHYTLLASTRPLVEAASGLLLPLRLPTPFELTLLLAVVLLGPAVGLLPALRAYRSALADGLAPRI